jgi:hypothetical protein
MRSQSRLRGGQTVGRKSVKGRDRVCRLGRRGRGVLRGSGDRRGGIGREPDGEVEGELVCVSNVQSCNGFGGMTPPQTQACVSLWGSCEGFGGMTKPQTQACLGNVPGACDGFGPSTDHTLQACAAIVPGACQGFGLGTASSTHTTTITPTALEATELKCSGVVVGKFLFDGIDCQETVLRFAVYKNGVLQPKSSHTFVRKVKVTVLRAAAHPRR